MKRRDLVVGNVFKYLDSFWSDEKYIVVAAATSEKHYQEQEAQHSYSVSSDWSSRGLEDLEVIMDNPPIPAQKTTSKLIVSDMELDRLQKYLIANNFITAGLSPVDAAIAVMENLSKTIAGAFNPPEDGKYLLWNPASKTPPKVPMVSRKQAYKVAGIMADKEPGQKFYVALLLDIVETEITRKVSKP